jgi:thymidine kinase
MNCGKSTAVLQVAHNYEERGMHVIVMKPALDTKGGARVTSRLNIARTVDIQATEADDVYQMISEKQASDSLLSCILVDEAQFLSTQHVEQLFAVATQLDIPVICYGLRVDFQTHAFSGSKRLFELAHSIEELKTVCRCGKKAILNGRKVNDKFVARGEQLAIDGQAAVTYESLCGNCYIKRVGPVGS